MLTLVEGRQCRLQVVHLVENLCYREFLGLDGGDGGRHQLVQAQAEPNQKEELEVFHGTSEAAGFGGRLCGRG